MQSGLPKKDQNKDLRDEFGKPALQARRAMVMVMVMIYQYQRLSQFETFTFSR
jgi:hypothetical protein